MNSEEVTVEPRPATTPDAEDETARRSLPARAVSAPAKARAVTPLSGLLIALALIAGLLVGGLIVRQRNQARQVMVSVNGKVITQTQFFHRLEIANGLPVMHSMVEEELQMQFATKKGLAPTDAEVQAQFAKISEQPGFEQRLAQSGQNVDDLKRELRLQIAKTNVLTQGVSITDADVQAYYAKQTNPSNPGAQFYQPATISLRAIATPSRSEADKALKELSSETPIELVASTYSHDPSKSNGGLLTPLVLGRSPLHTDPTLENAVFGLKVGDRVGPVLFAKQWWIFQCMDKFPPQTLPLAQVKDQCVVGAKITKAAAVNSERVQSEFVTFQRQSNLQSFWSRYQATISMK